MLQLVPPAFLLAAMQLRICLLRKPEVVGGMRLARGRSFPLCVQLFQPKLAQHIQHPEARLPGAFVLLVQQAFVQQ